MVESPHLPEIRAKRPAIWLRGLLAAAMVGAVAGCQAYSMGNPFLPRARLQAIVEDPTTTVTIMPTSTTNYTSAVSPQVTRFLLQPVPGDIAPASTITAFSIQWYDIDGATISSQLIPARTQGITVLVPKGVASTNGTSGSTSGTTGSTSGGSATTGANGEVDIPVVTNGVTGYGFDNGFTTDPVQNVAVPRTDQWSQYLTGKVTFSGRDENGWPIVGPDGVDPPTAYFQLEFITEASGSSSTSGSSVASSPAASSPAAGFAAGG